MIPGPPDPEPLMTLVGSRLPKAHPCLLLLSQSLPRRQGIRNVATLSFGLNGMDCDGPMSKPKMPQRTLLPTQSDHSSAYGQKWRPPNAPIQPTNGSHPLGVESSCCSGSCVELCILTVRDGWLNVRCNMQLLSLYCIEWFETNLDQETPEPSTTNLDPAQWIAMCGFPLPEFGLHRSHTLPLESEPTVTLYDRHHEGGSHIWPSNAKAPSRCHSTSSVLLGTLQVVRTSSSHRVR